MPSLTAEPELESKKETRNTVLDFNDFPDLFYGYKKKPYTIDFMGKEVKYEREAYKLRVRKEDKTINGVQYADIFYCYIDVKLKVSIAQ